MRTLRGIGGDVFEEKSPASIHVLEEMRTLLKAEGFAVARDRHKTTLRVYPRKIGEYPLMNPRLTGELGWAEGSDPDDPDAEPAFREIVTVMIYSRGNESLDGRLAAMTLPDGCHMIPAYIEDEDEDEAEDVVGDEAKDESDDEAVDPTDTAEAGEEPRGFSVHGYLIIPLSFVEHPDGAEVDLSLFRAAMREVRKAAMT